MRLSTVQLLGGLLLGALFLCLPAYYNLLPLWFRDTPAYLEAGFTNTVSNSTVWTYGGFVRHFSLKESLWLVIFLQGMLVTAIVYYSFKYIFTTRRAWHFMLYIIFVSMTTAASFHNSHIMPDIFTPILVLSTGLLLFAPAITKKDRVILSLFLLVSISMSNSHWGILMVSLLLLGAGSGVASLRAAYKATALSWKRIVWVLGLAGSSYLMVSSCHYALGGDFGATRGSSFYLFSRLWDFDLAQDYLAEHCETTAHPICRHLDDLTKGKDYLWGKEITSLSNQGGWSPANEAFFSGVNTAVLSNPAYLKRYIIKSIELTFAQLMYVQIEPNRTDRKEELLASFSRFFPAYKVATKYSRQHLSMYRAETVHAKSHLQALVLILSLVILLWFLLQQKMPPLPTVFTFFIVFSLLANALVVVSCWGYEDRLQSRVAWLITLPACWLCFRAWDNWRWSNNSRPPDFISSSSQNDVP